MIVALLQMSVQTGVKGWLMNLSEDMGKKYSYSRVHPTNTPRLQGGPDKGLAYVSGEKVAPSKCRAPMVSRLHF